MSTSGWWFGCHFLFSHILEISSSQLTNSCFSEGWPNHQPDIFEADLEYPQEIHDEQSDYPLAPKHTHTKILEQQSELHRNRYNGKEAKDKRQPKLNLFQ